MSKSFYPTKQFDSLTDAVAYCRVHAASQDALDYLHRIGTEAPDKHAALKAVVCALIDMGEQGFAADLVTEYDNSGAVTVHVESDACLTKTLFTPTTVREFMVSLGSVFSINRATCLINGEPIQPEALLKNGDTIEIK